MSSKVVVREYQNARLNMTARNEISAKLNFISLLVVYHVLVFVLGVFCTLLVQQREQ